MNELALLGSLQIVHLLALMSPGPNILIVTQTAMNQSRRSGVMVATGLAVGALLWSSAPLFGLGTLFAKWAWLYSGLAILGSVYLLYLGVTIFRFAAQPLAETELATIHSDLDAFRVGLLTSLTNPKVIHFFASLFTAVLAPTLPLWIRIASVGIVVADSLLWHTTLALFFSTQIVQKSSQGAKSWLD
jgi:threonine/homoserine/homoserine lactone efflux protein